MDYNGPKLFEFTEVQGHVLSLRFLHQGGDLVRDEIDGVAQYKHFAADDVLWEWHQIRHGILQYINEVPLA